MRYLYYVVVWMQTGSSGQYVTGEVESGYSPVQSASDVERLGRTLVTSKYLHVEQMPIVVQFYALLRPTVDEIITNTLEHRAGVQGKEQY